MGGQGSGGARARSGPPPDPNALYRDKDSKDWLTLPEKREGETPDWPLPEPTVAEMEMWEETWSLPQAVMWERQNQQREVALYVRAYLQAGKPGASANRISASLRLADSLGVTMPGMLRNRWKIGGAEEKPRRTKTKGASSSKERFKVVDGGA